MSRTVHAAVLCGVLFAFGDRNAAAADRLLAVLPLDVTNAEGKITRAGQASMEEVLRDVAANALSAAGWTVMTGETTLQVLHDNGIDPAKCGEAECHLTFAREISVDKFISGAIHWADDELVASIRLVDTRTGRILSAELLEGASARDLRRAFESKATSFFTRGGLLQASSPPPVSPAPVAAPPAKPPIAETPGSGNTTRPPPQPVVVTSPASNRRAASVSDAPPPRAAASDPGALWGTAPGSVRFESKAGIRYLWMPGGTFHFGCEPASGECGGDTGRRATVSGFWLGRTEVSLGAYTRCVKAGACTRPDDRGPDCTRFPHERKPVNCVTWDQAQAFCRWSGGHLPTDVEWEYAAKSGGTSPLPWGNAPVTAQRANYCDRTCPQALKPLDRLKWRREGWIDRTSDDGFSGPAPVGSYPTGATPWGLVDMVGNVWEWVDADVTKTSATACGGGYLQDKRVLRNWLKHAFERDSAKPVVGFRCRL
jgi:formylglycine-generating enzyme required for sulfatase activity